MSETTTALEMVDKSQMLAPVNLSSGVNLLPVEEMKPVLEEYTKRRDAFREWLLSQLIQGVHFGFPPGCEAQLDKHGNILQKNRKGEMVSIPHTQWRAKPSLYKAGALFLKDLLQLKGEYESDLDGWKMLGEPPGTFVRKCNLIRNGSIVGEGTGAFKVGTKGMQANAAIKMADKSALVAAVINTLATCADLFTQDPEDPTGPQPPTQAAQGDGFRDLVQAWVNEQVSDESPIAGHKVTVGEIKALRALLAMWCADSLPETAEDAMEWLRANAMIEPMDGKGGVIIGIQFVQKSGRESDEQENLPL